MTAAHTPHAAATPNSIAVIIPVRNMSAHIEACVAPLVRQLCPGDEVLVVDDGSTDDTAFLAERAGARVVQVRTGSGPYNARNFGVQSTGAPYLIFVDGRCRARPDWLEAHRALLALPNVDLSCTDVVVEPGESLASRISAGLEGFRVDHKVTGGPLDFFPTANLGVSRVAFTRVAGFRNIRSGADADLCWRIREDPKSRFGTDTRTLMSWVPRDDLADLIRQNYRYGRSSIMLEQLHPDRFASNRLYVRPIVSPHVLPTTRTARIGVRLINLPLRLGRLRGRFERRNLDSAVN